MPVDPDTAGGEPSFDELQQELARLPAAARRGVQALLALCVGDCVGVNFELFHHRANRQLVDKAAAQGAGELHAATLRLLVQRLGSSGPGNAYARPFTDDTVCTDLKMAALAECSELLQQADYASQEAGDLLWKCLLAQMLAWSAGRASGALFQGYGGFTKGLLRPTGSHRGGGAPSLYVSEDPPGFATWPEEWFLEHADGYCSGEAPGGVASYGNGGVMSLAPQALAPHVPQAPAALRDGAALWRLADTHRSDEARAGAKLLDGVVALVIGGRVASCADLAAAVRHSEPWKQLMASPLAKHPVYPLAAFDAFLETGDCSEGDAVAFVMSLTGADAPAMAPLPSGGYAGPGGGPQLGRLLRTAANWDDDHSGLQSERHIALETGQEIRFSQRALNSVLIALWCCCGARSMRDWLARLVYVGGDADTVGSVCGQVAGPLLGTEDVCAAYRRYAGLDDCSALRPCALVAHAAVRRYFRRSLLFCAGRWSELSRAARLVDPVYPGLTNSAGNKLQVLETVKVLWVDRIFAAGARLGRADLARRDAVEDAALQGSLSLSRASTYSAAEEMLQMGWCGLPDCQFDAVVAEQRLGADAHGGLGLLRLLGELWDGVRAEGAPPAPPRPLFCLLTPSWDREVAEEVRARPKACMARYDRPGDILQKVQQGLQPAAVLPPAGLLGL